MPWIPSALPTRSGNSSLTSGFAAMKYAPLASPIASAPTITSATLSAAAMNSDAPVRINPVAPIT